MSTIPQFEVHPIGFATTGITMSPEEFDAIIDFDDDYRYELVHGVLVVHAIPSVGESDPNEELGHMLRTYAETHPQAAALDRNLQQQIVRTGQNRRRPDRVIWTGLGRAPDLTEDLPSIVIEFVSAGRRDWRRDYIEKRKEYLAAGICEYWVIDRFERRMTVYRPPVDGVNELVVREGDTYRTPLLPGFELPLARLLAASDYWRKGK
jgi:Uma2 family endonuclease